MPLTNAELKECSDNEFYAYGTMTWFETRAQKYRRWLTILSWASFCIPLIAGGLVLVVENPQFVSMTRIVSGLLGVALSAIALWSLAANWPNKLSVAEKSIVANQELKAGWRELMTNSTGNDDIRERFSALKAKNLAQDGNDRLAEDITDTVKAWMMCTALYEYRKSCVLCGRMPKRRTPDGQKNDRCSMCGCKSS